VSTIYLDVCCLNRPFDDQSQDRVRIETAAILVILRRVDQGEWRWVGSEAVADEIDQAPDLERRRRVQLLTTKATMSLVGGPGDRARASEIVALGFEVYDAVHLAFAERARVDALLTTDDKFLRRARREAAQLRVRVENPVIWLNERLTP